MKSVGEAKTFTGDRGVYTLQRARDEGPPFNTYCVVTLPDGGGEFSFVGPAGWHSDDGSSSGIYSSDETYSFVETDCRRLAERFDHYELDPAEL